MSCQAAGSRGAAVTARGALVVLGGLVCQMGLGYNYVFGALAPALIGDFGWTKAEFSAARAPQLWVMAFGSPLVGFLVVRFGARRVLGFSTVLLGVSFLLLGRMGGLWQLYALLCLQALAATGLGDITVGQIVSQWFGRHRGLALGIVYTGSNLGGALVVRAAGWIEGAGTWRDVFSTMGVVALLGMFPLALWSVREPRGDERAEDTHVVDATAAEDTDVVGATAVEGLGLREAMRTRSFWLLAASLATFFFYFVGVLDHLVLFLTESGYSRGDAQAHLANAILLGMASKVGFGWIADRIPPRAAALLDFGLLGVSSLLLLFSPTVWSIGVFVLVFGFSAAARDVVYPLVLVDCFGVRAMAQIYGAVMLALPAGALGTWYAAAVSDRLGTYEPAFATFALLNALSFIGLFFLRDERAVAAGTPAYST